MDLDLFFIIIAVLYYATDLIGNYKKRKKTPNIPEQHVPEPTFDYMPAPTPPPIIMEKYWQEDTISDIPEKESVTKVVKPALGNNESNWNKSLKPALILNGVIFAEILQPPRAKRPLEAKFIRRR
ncbi:hypothetical protein [Dendrosporobacter sp. 1207_IL3150]|uniref:hypothetical protein n=1 Tax=Dendrosporobacter sp. 1207_IL3150 TaxID=3084054 RepID=UPI002FDA9FA1